ncbi:UNVERIFIED_CONTAM: hypothetical protein Sradi_0402200 [Sesamum radiatum]|uniref:Uncharacterized protein n=1 Tax=Sesamum radiatum TaxID=300843 RepID=A0AAW2W686_SESRA
MAEYTVSLKLLIDTHGKRLLFADAGKDFADYLFHILSLPVGTIVALIREQEMVGSLSNLYKSIENLNESYIQPNQSNDTFLKTSASDLTVAYECSSRLLDSLVKKYDFLCCFYLTSTYRDMRRV